MTNTWRSKKRRNPELDGLHQYVLLVTCRGSVMRESLPSSTLVSYASNLTPRGDGT